MGRMPATPLRLALAQSLSVPGEVGSNVRAAVATIGEAADRGAHLVVFPELFLTGYELTHLAENPRSWLDPDDARLDPVRRVCADRGVTAVLSAACRGPAGERTIAAPVVGPGGEVEISHKEHVHRSEQSLFQSGSPLPPFEVRGWRVAVALCFDAARPRHAERAALDGADLYAGSALYVRGEERRCDLHFGARAMDHRMFAALANHAGTTGGHESCGLSGVWGPEGEVLVREPGAGAALVLVNLDEGALRRHRGP